MNLHKCSSAWLDCYSHRAIAAESANPVSTPVIHISSNVKKLYHPWHNKSKQRRKCQTHLGLCDHTRPAIAAQGELAHCLLHSCSQTCIGYCILGEKSDSTDWRLRPQAHLAQLARSSAMGCFSFLLASFNLAKIPMTVQDCHCPYSTTHCSTEKYSHTLSQKIAALKQGWVSPVLCFTRSAKSSLKTEVCVSVSIKFSLM